METGFLPLSRKFFESDLWNEPRAFSRAEAWIDLVRTANFKPGTVIVDGRCLSLDKGELVASLRYVSNRWSWSKSKVERFYEVLKECRRIETRTETGITIVKLCNYKQFNGMIGRDRDGSGDDCGTLAGHSRDKEEEGNKVKKGRIQTPAAALPLRLQVVEFEVWWAKWLEHLRARRKTPSLHTQELQLAKLTDWGVQRSIAAIQYSIEQGWQGLFEPNPKRNGHHQTPATSETLPVQSL